MPAMHEAPRTLPAPNQIGIVAATVLLCYALTHLASRPGLTLVMQLPGFYFAYSLSMGTAMTLMAGGLTASGMDWLLRGHPSLHGRRTVQHWLLPTLTAVIIGVVLGILPDGPAWWTGLAIGAVILVAVLLAEYITVDPGAAFHALASAGLTALSYTLFLLFVLSLRLGAARLFLVVPAVFIAAGLVSLRTLHLRLGERWDYPWAFGIGLVCAQIAAGVHYWPLPSLAFGLTVLAPLYALTALATGLSEDLPWRNAMTEPAMILGGLWAAAAILR
jgi:hypothetical protein